MSFLSYDIAVFRIINQKLTHPILDTFFSNFTNLHHHKILLWGLVPLLFGFWFYKQRWIAIKVLISMTVLISLADALSYRVIKEYAFRKRPHHIQEQTGAIVRVGYGPKSGSFPSNHAFSSMTVAVFLALLFRKYAFVFLFIALLNGYGRVYVGVHFPSDVLGGFVMGTLLGFSYFYGLKRLMKPGFWET